MTTLTRVLDNLPHTLTGRTGLLNRKNTLLHTYLANTTTGGTGGFLTILCTASVTGLATSKCRDAYFAGNPRYRFFKVKVHRITKIRATLLTRTGTTAPATEN